MNNLNKSPKLLIRLFRWFCHPDYAEDIEGDLLERFDNNAQQKGITRAKWIFTFEVIRLFRPGLIRSLRGSSQLNNYGMLQNYLKIAFRVFKREKSYSLINVFGLALAFVCCLFIYLFVSDELSYDHFNQDADRIYRISSAYMREGRWEPYASNSWKTAELIKANFDEVEELVRVRPVSEMVEYDQKRFLEDYLAVVDDNFFEVFTFPLVSGNPKSALSGANKLVISMSMARKYFGNEEAIGKVLSVRDGEFSLQVSGVMKDMPSNSHFHFDFLISPETQRKMSHPALFTNVGWDSQHVYAKMRPGVDVSDLEERFPKFIDDNLEYLTSGNFKLFFQPLLDIHLKSDLGLEIEPNGSITHVYIFSIIAVFILFIACINYMNLTTARSLRRSREVGMRKVLGAKRGNLINQFLLESFTMTFIALILAMIASCVALPWFNDFAGKSINFSNLFSVELVIALVVGFVVIGFIAGGYPAFVLSSFKPVTIVKSGRYTGKGTLAMRRGLVVLQFVISIGLIASTVVVFRQLRFMQEKDLGINEEQLISIPLQTMDRQQLGAFRNEVLKDPSVKDMGLTNMKMPGWISYSTYYSAQDEEQDEEARKSLKIIRVDDHFLDVVEAEMVAGRNFSEEFPSDITTSLVLNESAVKQLVWEDPIGKWIELDDEQRYYVVGVVKDFHFESLHRKIPPTVFKLTSDFFAFAYVKVDPSNLGHTLDHLEEIYGQFVSNRDFYSSFVSEDIERQYQAEVKFTQIFRVFTVLAILIASLGTFGLISFTAERKSKEIGIRKVLGATIANLTFLLTREFIILLLIASLIAWPITYYFIKGWIDDFIYRTTIGFEPFITATVLAVIIAISTTVFRSVKTAIANPVNSLRDE